MSRFINCKHISERFNYIHLNYLKLLVQDGINNCTSVHEVSKTWSRCLDIWHFMISNHPSIDGLRIILNYWVQLHSQSSSNHHYFAPFWWLGSWARISSKVLWIICVYSREKYSEDKIINVLLEEGIRVIALSDIYRYCYKQRIKEWKRWIILFFSQVHSSIHLIELL